MPLPASVTTVPLHIKVLGSDGTAGKGQVALTGPVALRDGTGNVVVGAPFYRATLDANGEATLFPIATDDPDLSPSGWAYTANVVTDVWRETFQIQIPVSTVGTLELAKTAAAVVGPALVTYETPAGAQAKASAAQTVAISTAATDAVSKYGRLETALNLSPASGVIVGLRNSRSVVMQLVGDSTGDATDEWFALLGLKIAAAYPSFNVLWRPWNLTAQWYDMPTTLQAGASGDRFITIASGGALQYAANAITGDLDVRAKIRPASWTNATAQTVVCRYDSAVNQRGFWLRINPSGVLALVWSTTGSADNPQVVSTVAVPFAAGTIGWVRATLDVDNGAAGNTVTFYTSTDGAAWTQLGAAVVTAGTTSIFASTASYQIGSASSTFGSSLIGDLFWVEVRDGIGGISLVPPLPDSWDQVSAVAGGTNTVTLGGSPTLLLVGGSEGGQNIAYFDNATRRPKLMSAHGQHLILLSTGHNEGSTTTQKWINAYSTWASDIKTLLPGVPIVALTQNPTKPPHSQNDTDVRASRGVALMTWARSQPGVYGVDTYPPFTDLANQVESALGTHPTAAGSAVWRDYLYRVLFSGV